MLLLLMLAGITDNVRKTVKGICWWVESVQSIVGANPEYALFIVVECRNVVA